MYSLVRSQWATAHTLQNVSEVNRERSSLAAASSVCDSVVRVCFYDVTTALFCRGLSKKKQTLTTDSTKHNGLVTLVQWGSEYRKHKGIFSVRYWMIRASEYWTQVLSSWVICAIWFRIVRWSRDWSDSSKIWNDFSYFWIVTFAIRNSLLN